MNIEFYPLKFIPSNPEDLRILNKMAEECEIANERFVLKKHNEINCALKESKRQMKESKRQMKEYHEKINQKMTKVSLGKLEQELSELTEKYQILVQENHRLKRQLALIEFPMRRIDITCLN